MADTTASSDLLFRPALELAGLVRTGELSARELVEISLGRIDTLNPELNAFVETSGRSPACRSQSRTTVRSPATG